jgi:hypothetical protein
MFNGTATLRTHASLRFTTATAELAQHEHEYSYCLPLTHAAARSLVMPLYHKVAQEYRIPHSLHSHPGSSPHGLYRLLIPHPSHLPLNPLHSLLAVRSRPAARTSPRSHSTFRVHHLAHRPIEIGLTTELPRFRARCGLGDGGDRDLHDFERGEELGERGSEGFGGLGQRGDYDPS